MGLLRLVEEFEHVEYVFTVLLALFCSLSMKKNLVSALVKFGSKLSSSCLVIIVDVVVDKMGS